MFYNYEIDNFDQIFNYHNNQIDYVQLSGVFNNQYFNSTWLSYRDATSFLFKIYQAIYMKEREGINFLLRHLDWLSVSNKLEPESIEDFHGITGYLTITYQLNSSVHFYDDFIHDINHQHQTWDSRAILEEAINLRLENDDEYINSLMRDDVQQEIIYHRHEPQPQPQRPINSRKRLRKKPQRYGYGIHLINTLRNESINLNRLLNIKTLNLSNTLINHLL